MRPAGSPDAPDGKTLGWLTARADYLAIGDRDRPKASKYSTPFFVLQIRTLDHEDYAWRVGLTASRRVGNSVARSRAKRRLRDLARRHLPQLARPGFDAVLIARAPCVKAPFPLLLASFAEAVRRLKMDQPS